MQNAKLKNIWIKVQNQKIKGTLFYPPKVKSKNPGVLFIHGWSTGEENYVKRAAAVAEKGAICLTISLRGHSKSDGKLEEFSRQDHLEDVIAAHDFLVSQENVDPNKVGVCGASYGGYLASILSSKRNIKWLALRVPALYPDEKFNIPTAQLIIEDQNVFRQQKIETKENIALTAISQFANPMLLIESENDIVVPHQTTENYIRSMQNNKNVTHIVIKNADHDLTKEEWKQEFIDILVKWFGEKFINKD